MQRMHRFGISVHQKSFYGWTQGSEGVEGKEGKGGEVGRQGLTEMTPLTTDKYFHVFVK